MPANLRLGYPPAEPRFGSYSDPDSKVMISGDNAVIPCVLDGTPRRLIDIIEAAIPLEDDRSVYFSKCVCWRYEDDTGSTLTEPIAWSPNQADAGDVTKCQQHDLQGTFSGTEVSSLWVRTVSGTASTGRLVGLQ